MHTTFDIHPDVQLFDSLPDSALVPSSVVTRVLGISRSGLWLGVKEGRIPAPVKLGDRTTRFQVCLLYTSPSPRDRYISRMPSSA